MLALGLNIGLSVCCAVLLVWNLRLATAYRTLAKRAAPDWMAGEWGQQFARAIAAGKSPAVGPAKPGPSDDPAPSPVLR
jgi:hypothetical protein